MLSQITMADETPCSSRSLNEETLSSIVRQVYSAMAELPEESHPNHRRGRETFNNTQEELYTRFRIPRGNQTASTSISSSVNHDNHNANGDVNVSVLRQTTIPQFNPRLNYGSNNRPKSGKRKSPANPTKGKSVAAKKKAQISTKEVILLPSPDFDEVPRFSKKRRLQELGLIIDGFPFDRNWDASELRLKVGLQGLKVYVQYCILSS